MRLSIVTSILLAGLLACSSTAIAGPTDTQKCEAAKIKETGKYCLCRMKAESKAAKKNDDPDFTKCNDKLAAKFQTIEDKFGSACTTLGDASQILAQVEESSTDLACQLKGFSEAPGASIVVFENLDVSATNDPTLKLRNVANNQVDLRCFYAGRPTCSTPLAEFDLTLIKQETVEWQASQGIFFTIPPVDVPFQGDLVCVQVDVTGSPLAGNHITGSHSNPDECPVSVIGIQGGFSNDGNDFLELGSEYDSCPASIGETHIESCWSNSIFTFDCN